MTTTVEDGARTFRARPFRRAFDDVPRYWFDDSAVATHLVNALNLLFPAGERFFVRSVRRYEDRVADPALARQVKAFYAQEGRHAHAHERYFDTLRAQGYAIDGLVSKLERVLAAASAQKRRAAVRLAITVALEHYTAIMAELALTDPYFERMHPAMRELFAWHAAEEIEHRAVAFDVLRAVHPGYGLRMTGFALATIGLVGFWIAGTASLLRQDRVPLARVAREARDVLSRGVLGERIFLRAWAEYVRRDFHPLDRDDFGLAAATLARFEAEA